jgi:hypothetical protein
VRTKDRKMRLSEAVQKPKNKVIAKIAQAAANHVLGELVNTLKKSTRKVSVRRRSWLYSAVLVPKRLEKTINRLIRELGQADLCACSQVSFLSRIDLAG